MNRSLQITVACVALLVAVPGATFGAVIEVGDLNIIDDPGNPSDGLRFLDLTYSTGLTLADALANAQGTYSNARLATPDEWDDLFAAAGIMYDGASTASDAFTTGPTSNISSFTNYDGGALLMALGPTSVILLGPQAWLWSDPDGSDGPLSTRDLLNLTNATATAFHTTSTPPRGDVAWLLVTEPQVAAVPEPSSLMLMGIGAVGLLGYHLRRNRKRSRVTS